MSKDPAILLYTADFLSGVADLTMEERGQYITMLCTQHQKGMISKRWLDINLPNPSPEVLSKFHEDENGNLINPRMKEEIANRKKFRPRRLAITTLGGLISGYKLNAREKAKIKKKFVIDDFINLPEDQVKIKVREWFNSLVNIAYVNHIEDENKNEDKDYNNKKGVEKIVTAEVWPSFNDFWDLYDKKVGDKSKIQKKWNKLSHNDKLKAMDHIPLYRDAQPNKKYRYNPETYLNQKGWTHELIYDDKKSDNNGKSALEIARDALGQIDQMSGQ